ncbi:MAG: hypothetical protein R3B37_08080 [Nitrospira sp.]|nr:hypothetical protein [Nitrospira sp.]
MKNILIAVAVVLIGAIPSLSFAIGSGATFSGCGAGDSSKLFGAFAHLSKVVSSGFGEFLQCIDDAYLVEHGGRTAHKIARGFANSHITRVRCTDLSQANAEAPVKISGEMLKIDRDFMRSNDELRIASVIAHELAHNQGFSHKRNDSGSTYYGNTVPEQIESCVWKGKPNSWPGPGSPTVIPANIVGMGIDGTNNNVFAWYRDGTVTAGTTDKLHSRRTPYKYKLPGGKQPTDIVGMAIDGSNGMNFAWYRDGTVSAGSSDNLSSKRLPYKYRLPAGYSPDDIVGMGLDDDNNNVFAWYRDGKVSAGTTDNLGSRRAPYPYTLPAGKTAGDIVGMAVDGDNNNVFAWFSDGTVSAGTTENMLIRRPPYQYEAGR